MMTLVLVLSTFPLQGYVYDVETGLYYLRSRYYNTEIKRFLNSDSYILGNLYSYCTKNPVNYYDPNGAIEDYTNCINQVISEAVPEFIAHGVSIPFEEPGALDFVYDIDSYTWFMKQVNSNARWDVKIPDSWKRVFPDLPVPDSKQIFIFRGLEITSEDLGNILYGYFGTAMGINEKVLYAAGGVAKQLKHVSIDSEEEMFKVLDTMVDCYLLEDKFYGDDENDHKYKKIGIGMYRNDYLY